MLGQQSSMHWFESISTKWSHFISKIDFAFVSIRDKQLKVSSNKTQNKISEGGNLSIMTSDKDEVKRWLLSLSFGSHLNWLRNDLEIKESFFGRKCSQKRFAMRKYWRKTQWSEDLSMLHQFRLITYFPGFFNFVSSKKSSTIPRTYKSKWINSRFSNKLCKNTWAQHIESNFISPK